MDRKQTSEWLIKQGEWAAQKLAAWAVKGFNPVVQWDPPTANLTRFGQSDAAIEAAARLDLINGTLALMKDQYGSAEILDVLGTHIESFIIKGWASSGQMGNICDAVYLRQAFLFRRELVAMNVNFPKEG